MNNTTVTVYGVDVDLNNEVECKPIQYHVEKDSNSEKLYTLIRDALVFPGHVPYQPLTDKAIIGVQTNQVMFQISTEDASDIVMLLVPLVGTKLSLPNFQLGSFVGDVLPISDVTRSSLLGRLKDLVQYEYQCYLNTLATTKKAGGFQ